MKDMRKNAIQMENHKLEVKGFNRLRYPGSGLNAVETISTKGFLLIFTLAVAPSVSSPAARPRTCNRFLGRTNS